LSPRTLITEYKTQLRKNGVPLPADIKEAVADPHRNKKMVPISRLTSRLGLSKYDKPAPLSEDEISPKKVRITFNQNIGAPAKPIVKKGDAVTVGQIIADVDEKSLGLPIHSSINGVVVDANEHFIIIKRD
jgi:ribosomal protein L18E